MKVLKYFLLVCLSIFILSRCGNKHGKPVEIEDLKEYKDEAVGFSLKYPSNWVVTKLTGVRFAAFSSNNAKLRFARYDTEGFPGAKIDLNVVKIDSVVTLDSIIKVNKTFQPDLYKFDEVMIDGVKASRFRYSFELEDGEFVGELYVATKDGKLATVLFFEAFANTWDMYKDKFNEIVSSLKLAVEPAAPTAVTINVEEPPASANLVPKSGPGYVIMVPDNFNLTKGIARNVISSQNYIGKRRADCNIQVDVIDASQSKNLKKIVEENRPTYKNSGEPRSINLGGVEAYVFPYQPTGQVKGRVYFALKGDRLYRITMNWFVGEEKDYLPVFEKSVNSIKFE
ncbi:MAG TPA: PsbP-related protein [Candidatus Kapabacteria bacterium]|nr:PsbP-related protein [Candidatus Kapabacteria bacterium]